jgi:Holliday junction DNA helicase RuvB
MIEEQTPQNKKGEGETHPELTGKKRENETKIDKALRPRDFSEFIGQKRVIKNLNIIIEAAKEREDSLDHILFHGPPGLGKTTLAHIIAKEMSVAIKTISGPNVEKTGELGSILTNLSGKDVLFIDEIHRLNKDVEESLYSAMEDYCLDVIVGKGPSAKTLQIDLEDFTLVSATTRAGLLSAPLRNRFGIQYHLNFYDQEEMEKVVKRSAELLGREIEPEAVRTIASASRGTPRVANRLLKRVRDYTQINSESEVINRKTAEQTLKMLEIDKKGLSAMDRKILSTIINKYGGGPVGVKTIAAACGEEPENIEQLYEPYLLQIGFLDRTAKGRVATKPAYKHLGLKEKAQQSGMFEN